MAGPRVSVVRTGLANLASVLAGFERIGAHPHITENPADVRNATHVVLPGVGTFGYAMKHLRECGLVEPLRERIRGGRPTVCICVGHQILCRESDESPGMEGLSIVDAVVRRFPAGVMVPQFGWNRLAPRGEHAFVDEGYGYFANSYALQESPGDGWQLAYAFHGVQFVAAMEKGALLSCQFHPELSGKYGLALLKRWLERAEKGNL